MRWSHLVACSGLGLPVWFYPCSRVLELLLSTALPCNFCGSCSYLIICLWCGSGCLSWYWLPEVTLNFETTGPCFHRPSPSAWITGVHSTTPSLWSAGEHTQALLCARQTDKHFTYQWREVSTFTCWFILYVFLFFNLYLTVNLSEFWTSGAYLLL